MKLRQKLILSYIFLIIIPWGIFMLFYSINISPSIESQVKYTAKQNFEQTYSFLFYKIKKILEISNIIILDKKLNSILSQKNDLLDVYKQMGDSIDLSQFLQLYQNDDEIYQIKLYVNDNLFYSTENLNLFGINSISKSKWFKRMEFEIGKVFWPPPFSGENITDKAARVISAVRLIPDPNDYLNEVGVLSIEILESNLSSILKKHHLLKTALLTSLTQETKYSLHQ